MIHRWLHLAIAAWLTGASAFGADEAVSASVRVDVQMVSVSVPDARLLVPKLQDPATAQRTFDRLQEMIAQDKAVLMSWPMIWVNLTPSVPSERVVSETVLEFRYPTEFVPPRIPQSWGARGNIQPYRLVDQWGAANFTAFEARNTGATLDVEPSIEDNGRIILLNLRPQFVRFLESRKYRIPSSQWGISGEIEQPDFANSITSTQIRAVHDRPTLVGIFVREKPEPNVELFILRARATIHPVTVRGSAPAP